MDDFDDPDAIALIDAAERRAAAGTGTGSNSRQAQASLPSSRAPAAASASSSSTTAPKVQQPTPQALPQRSLPSAILVSTRQKGNPILSHISGVPWEYAETPADYVLGTSTCALFLSLKYHRLHPEYIYGRIRALAGRYGLRVLLCLVDIDNHEEPLRELAKTGLVNDLTLILAWSAREAARYLEAYRALERVEPVAIKGARAATFAEHMTDFVTTPRGINKTDAVSLVGSFGSVRHAVNAERDQIMAVPGWGQKKADRFIASVNEPFRIGRSRAKGGISTGGGKRPEPVDLGTLSSKELSRLAQERSRGTPEASADAGRQGMGSGNKRAGDDSLAYEPDKDEEEALFLAERGPGDAAPTVVVAPTEVGGAAAAPNGNSGRKRNEEPQLSAGVQAALDRLRNK